MEDDNVQFQNVDSWKRGGSSKFGWSFIPIVLEHIRRVVVNGSTEWHGGYWNETGYNPVIRNYVPNSRDVYNNSVRMLRALLLCNYDDKIKPIDKKIQQELDEAYKKYISAEDPKTAKYEFYDVKVNIYIRLFEELIKLSKRLNFFEEEASEEAQ